MDELLDLVNEKDEVIGEVWRSEATGNKNIIIREIAILIFDKKKNILLQQRSLSKKSYPGYWTISASGHVPKGDKVEETAKRELYEELGINLDIKLLDKQLKRYPNDSAVAYRYVGEYKNEKLVTQKEEVEKIRFFNKEKFEELCKTNKVEPTSAQWCREFWKNN
ncbi:MAG: NUDIX domain-containing protein [Microgenomates group bacterium]